MPIDNLNVVDLISTDSKTGEVVLTISDHLDWEDGNTHLHILQEKINAYLSFIESGEIYESYSKAKGKKLLIGVVGKYELPPEGENFLEKAKPIIKEIGIELRFSLLTIPE